MLFLLSCLFSCYSYLSSLIKLGAIWSNLSSTIFRRLHNCRCLRSFLIAAPAMSHSLMLA
jgi:hypothetical protein